MGKFNVVIIEDDFRIARIHEEMIEQNDSFRVVQNCLTAKEALEYLAEVEQLPHVILLDMYIPDVKGFDLLETLKGKYPYIAIIIASAADDMETFERAKLIGVFDYMTKPIEQKRLQLAFQKYAQFMAFEAEAITQVELDAFFGQGTFVETSTVTKTAKDTLPKGIDTLTLEKIRSFLMTYHDTEITAHTLGDVIGISRSTARRYLEYLGRLEIVSPTLHYGQVGRPQRIYIIREQYEQN